MGSIARTSPGWSTSPLPGCPKFGTCGSSCGSRPMPWPTRSRTTVKPAVSATCWTALPTSPSRLPATACAIPRLQRRLGHVQQQRLASRVDVTDREGDRRVRVPAVQPHAGIDADDVALLQDPVARAGCRAPPRRSPRCRGSPESRTSPLKAGTAPSCDRMNSSANTIQLERWCMPGLTSGRIASKSCARMAPAAAIASISCGGLERNHRPESCQKSCLHRRRWCGRHRIVKHRRTPCPIIVEQRRGLLTDRRRAGAVTVPASSSLRWTSALSAPVADRLPVFGLSKYML